MKRCSFGTKKGQCKLLASKYVDDNNNFCWCHQTVPFIPPNPNEGSYNFCTMGNVIVANVLKYLGRRDINNLITVDRASRSKLSDKKLWRAMVKIHFGIDVKEDVNSRRVYYDCLTTAYIGLSRGNFEKFESQIHKIIGIRRATAYLKADGSLFINLTLIDTNVQDIHSANGCLFYIKEKDLYVWYWEDILEENFQFKKIGTLDEVERLENLYLVFSAFDEVWTLNNKHLYGFVCQWNSENIKSGYERLRWYKGGKQWNIKTIYSPELFTDGENNLYYNNKDLIILDSDVKTADIFKRSDKHRVIYWAKDNVLYYAIVKRAFEKEKVRKVVFSSNIKRIQLFDPNGYNPNCLVHTDTGDLYVHAYLACMNSLFTNTAIPYKGQKKTLILIGKGVVDFSTDGNVFTYLTC